MSLRASSSHCPRPTAAGHLPRSDALTTGATWDLLREHHAFSSRDAQRTMADAVVAQLESCA